MSTSNTYCSPLLHNLIFHSFISFSYLLCCFFFLSLLTSLLFHVFSQVTFSISILCLVLQLVVHIIKCTCTHNFQATGEVKFVADLAPRQGQLYAAPVLSAQGNARIQSIDPSFALVSATALRVLLLQNSV